MPQKFHAVQRYRYIITDIETGDTHQCVREPEGWDAYGVTFGRETGISNVVKGYVSSWSFLKEDARWLRDMLLQYGPNRRLRMRVLDDATNLRTTSETVYVGDIDLTMAEWDGVKFTAPTSEGGFFKALENKWDEKYDVDFDSYIKIDGAVMGDQSPLQGTSHITSRYNPLKSNHACFIPKMEFTNETELNEEFLNNTEMVQLNFSFPNTAVPNYVTGDPRTHIGKDMSFFHCGVRKLMKLKLTFDIEASASIQGLVIGENKQFKCWHRLAIYGVPTRRFDESVTNYLTYEVNNMQAQIDPVYNHQYYHELDVSSEVVTVKKSDGVLYANYVASFSGEYEIDDFDTLNNTGMSFFLVVEFDCGRMYQGGVVTNTVTYMNQGSEIDIYMRKNTCNAEYVMQLNQHKYIAAVKSVDVFRELIANISNGRYQVNTDITAFDAVAGDDFLTAGEGMRNKPRMPYRVFNIHGKLSTSLADFLQYAYAVYGFRFGVKVSGGSYTVYLAHQPYMYEQGTVIGQIRDTRDMLFSVAREMLYSAIRVGYDTDTDIFDAVNEFNNTQVWNTPNTEIEGNELDLVSPYSASSKAVETFLFKNYANWGDASKEEEDIYLINGEYVGQYAPSVPEITGPEYELKRYVTVLAGVDYPKTQWNLKYTPKRMLQAHAVELNSLLAFESGKLITLETCDLNRSLVSYDGTPPIAWTLTPVAQGGGIQQGLHHGNHYPVGSIIEEEAVTIGTNTRFVPVTVSFKAIAGRKWIKMIEANRLGVIEVRDGGNTLRGFIADGDSSITVNPIEESQSEFKLLLAKI